MKKTTVDTTASNRRINKQAAEPKFTVEDLRKNPTCTIPQAGEILGLGRVAAYELAKKGGIKTIQLSERTYRVPSRWLLELIGEEA
ncbi:hypothetical protein [Rhodococcus triatomae]|nr:DNA-binding domain-containing protein [Rhodococcus triatomae BKS 15-14]